MTNNERPFQLSPSEAASSEAVSLATAIERIEAGLLEGDGQSIGYSDSGYREVDESSRAWVAGSFSVDEKDPSAPLVQGRMITEIMYDAAVMRDPSDWGGLSMMLLRETEPGHLVQFNVYSDGKIYSPRERGLHASLTEDDRGEEVQASLSDTLRKQLATAAGFGKPRF